MHDAHETSPNVRRGDVPGRRGSRGRHHRAGNQRAQLGADLVDRVAPRVARRDVPPAREPPQVFAAVAPARAPVALTPEDAERRAEAANEVKRLPGATRVGNGRVAEPGLEGEKRECEYRENLAALGVSKLGSGPRCTDKLPRCWAKCWAIGIPKGTRWGLAPGHYGPAALEWDSPRHHWRVAANHKKSGWAQGAAD